MVPTSGSGKAPSAIPPVWLPLPFYVLTVFVLYQVKTDATWESQPLLTALNTLLCSSTALLTAYLAGWFYLQQSSRQMLSLGCGALIFGLVFFLSGPLLFRLDVAIANHVIGCVLAGGLFALSAWSSRANDFRQRRPGSGLVLGLSYLVSIAVVATVIWLAWVEILPKFYIQDLGPTALRSLGLGIAFFEFMIATAGFGLIHRRTGSRFCGLYAVGLALIGLGLATVGLRSPGTLISWAGRFGQYAGAVYMLLAVISLIRHAELRQISLRRAVTETLSPFGVNSLANAEQALRDSEARYEALADSMPQLVWTAAPDGRVDYYNRRHIEFMGFAQKSKNDWDWVPAVHPDDLEQTVNAWQNAVKTGEVYQVEHRVQRADGSFHWYLSRGIPARDSSGRIIKWYGTATDIDQLKQLQQTIDEHQSRLRMAAEAGQLGTYSYDFATNEMRCSEEFLHLYHFDPRRPLLLEGELTPTYLDSRDYLRFVEARNRSIDPHGSGQLSGEFRIRGDDGVERWLMFRGQTFFEETESGRKPTRASGIIVDITSQKQTERELLRLAQRLELLAETSAVLLRSKDPTQVIESLCRQVLGHLDCDIFFNFLLDEPTGMLHLNSCGGIAREEVKQVEWLEIGSAVCGCVAECGNPIVKEHIQDQPEAMTEFVSGLGIRAYACHPLLDSRGQVIGTLSFGTCDRDAFDEGDVSLMRAITDQVAVALARYKDQCMLEHFLNRQTYIAEAGARILEQNEISGLMRVVAEMARSISFAKCAYAEIKNAQDESSSVAACGADECEAPALAAAIEDVLKNQPSIRLAGAEIRSHPLLQTFVREDCAPEPLLATRLIGADQSTKGLIILLGVDNGASQFSREDEAAVLQLAALCSLALQHMEARTHAEQARDELDVRVQLRTAEAEHRAKQLQALALQLTQAEEKERQRLAHVLHEDLQQILVGAGYHLSLVKRRLSENSGEQSDELRQVEELLGQAVNKSRSLSHELSPPVLQHAGLASALRWLSIRMEDMYGVAVKVQALDNAEPQDHNLKIFLFKAAQEMLLNVVKHSGAMSSTVSIEREGGGVALKVRDEGCGFDVENVNSGVGLVGFGLMTIRERIDYFGGRMKMRSTPGQGAEFAIWVPDSIQTEPPADGDQLNSQLPQLGHEERAQKLKILLVDDNEVMRQGLRLLLENEDGVSVIGEASDGYEALALAKKLQPDVIIMDVSMPGMDGMKATRRIKGILPNAHIIGLTMLETSDIGPKMLAAGAEACLSKADPSDELLESILAMRH